MWVVAELYSKTVQKLLANADAFLSMTRKRKSIAVRSLVKYSLLSLIIIVLYIYSLTRPASTATELQTFEVAKGESVQSVATSLKSAGLIRSPLYFRLIVRQHELTVQAGIYRLSPSLTVPTIAQSLTRGLAVDKTLTIPEGYRSEQIAETAGLPVKEFLTVVGNMEGQLFPDTYFVREDVTSEELVTIMHDNFVKKVGNLDRESLILASLVERETRATDEKPIVAGILKKRLSAGWALELDATVQYFLGKPGAWWPNTTLLDRRLASPYNTYLHRGLPPGPIGNPGLAAIDAVRNAKDSPYWFYLHDRMGQIHYAETNAQHAHNISQYIK